MSSCRNSRAANCLDGLEFGPHSAHTGLLAPPLHPHSSSPIRKDQPKRCPSAEIQPGRSLGIICFHLTTLARLHSSAERCQRLVSSTSSFGSTNPNELAVYLPRTHSQLASPGPSPAGPTLSHDWSLNKLNTHCDSGEPPCAYYAVRDQRKWKWPAASWQRPGTCLGYSGANVTR